MADNIPLTRRVVFVAAGTPIGSAVQTMVEKQISSLLVYDNHQLVTGILTERDIVRKFTLLTVEDKMTRTVATIMSRPVQFVRMHHVISDMTELFLTRKIRHFPILEGTEPHCDKIVGMISSSDLLRQKLIAEQQSEESAPRVEPPPRPLAVLVPNDKRFETYAAIFRGFGFKPLHVSNFNRFIAAHPHHEIPLLFDFDGYPEKVLKDLIVQTRRYRGEMIMTTANTQLVILFRQYLDPTRHIISIKPLDVSYCHWFLTRNPPPTGEVDAAGF